MDKRTPWLVRDVSACCGLVGTLVSGFGHVWRHGTVGAGHYQSELLQGGETNCQPPGSGVTLFTAFQGGVAWGGALQAE